MKIRKLYIIIIVIFLLLLIIGFTYSIFLESMAKYLVVNEELYKSDAIIILGSGSSERLNYGVKLYKSGYGKSIIITGMPIQLPGIMTTWPRLAMQSALEKGVPQKAIILEERPTSTYEDALYVKEKMIEYNFKSAIVVSSPYHMKRVSVTFRKVFKDQKDISLIFSASDSEEFVIQKWWTREKELVFVITEYCKLMIYLFRYII